MTMKRYADMVTGAARRSPDSTAVITTDQRLTYGELDDRVGRLGGALRGRGLSPGDRVALLAANELEYVEIQAACARSGFTLVPLNTRLADAELRYIIGDAAPAVIIAGRAESERVERLAANAGAAAVGLGETASLEPYDSLIADGEPDPDADPVDPTLNTTFLYTSGTTGRPKGAMIDRAGMTARMFVNAVELDARPDDVFLQSLPMFHIGAFLTYAYMFRGGATVMLPTFTPAGWFELQQRERATATVLVPTLIAMLLDHAEGASADTSALRLIVYGGAPIDPPLLRRAMARFECGFHQQYGMTETGAQTILRPADHDPNDQEALSSGGAEAISFEVEIIDEHDRPLGVDQVGEICCRGPAVMSGYWKLPEASAETLRNGWMHTGDVGYRDKRGFLHVVDRRNDMIITGGENVYPREVEAVLAEHPARPDVAVIGVADPKWGQLVTAVVGGNAPADEELEAWVRDRLAGYKVPRRWVRVPELPRNATGKVLKVELRQGLTP